MEDAGRGRVLVVDDEPDIREVLCLALRTEGYEVRSAEDGSDALEQLNGWNPGVILLDWVMPGLDGAAFLTAWSADARAAATPVVVLSAGRWWPGAVSGIRPAVFLAKPFSLPQLLDLVERLRTAAG
jgi:DNA-binding response OmpR family regulator